MLIRSLDRFWVGKSPLVLWIIARDACVRQIQASLHSERIRIRVARESEVLPQLLQREEAPGWYKQQMLKLAAHAIVGSAFYLVLDADLICTQPFSDETLIVDGKALTDWEPKSVHADWWSGSAAVLKHPVGIETFGMSVTPEVLSTYVCDQLLKHLAQLHRMDWCDLLLQNQIWTEYTLYCLFATRGGHIDQFHHSREWMETNRRALRSQLNVWHREDFKAWQPEYAFAPGSIGVFMVCQSNTEIHPAKVWRKLRGYLG
jgi:hypothetical protein